ncbi:Fbox/WD repeatcontaining protein sel10like [Caligus rogercresseyi]|uniref:Fbox/WD repeatcontaining protein sel10like n=1 Tax=Caligus rogercresseyi TaxID=217165 RepID=A0A7T8KCR9_CALRO|nr:Fbox/WD repeatcontaining protein sel10like [Caligus rogercresseyi]
MVRGDGRVPLYAIWSRGRCYLHFSGDRSNCDGFYGSTGCPRKGTQGSLDA